MKKSFRRERLKAFTPGTGVALTAAATALSACVSYEDPYARLYDACDKRAGVCYQQCDNFRFEDDRRRCQSDCSFEADKCFGDISELASRDSTYYAGWNTYYGRFGSWYPSRGYRYGPHGYPYTYNYGYGGYGGGYGYDYDTDRDARDEAVEVQRSTGKPNTPNPKSLPKLPAGEPPIRPTGKPNTQPKPPVTSPPKPSKPKPAPSKPPSKPSKPVKPITKPSTPAKQPD